MFTLVAFATSVMGIALAGIILLWVRRSLGFTRISPMNEKNMKHYEGFYDGNEKEEEEDSSSDSEEFNSELKNSSTLSRVFYDICTDFYRFGWGECFHFAPCGLGETFKESLARHEYMLSHSLRLRSGIKVADFGCGVAGPMQNIARFSGAQIVGINNNAYQIELAKKSVAKNGLNHLCSFANTDWMNAKEFEDNHFDAAYAIEASCHAADRVGHYAEVLRLLKPGGVFGSYEWCLTDKYDPENETHRHLKYEVMRTNGMPDLLTTSEVAESVRKAGFHIIVATDYNHDEKFLKRYPVPWQEPLKRGFSLKGLPHTVIGRYVISGLVASLETLRLVPKGATHSHGILMDAANSIVQAADLGIVTQSFLVVARKPSTASQMVGTSSTSRSNVSAA